MAALTHDMCACILRNFDTDIVAVPLKVSSFLDKQMPPFLRTTFLIYCFIIFFPLIVITLFSVTRRSRSDSVSQSVSQ